MIQHERAVRKILISTQVVLHARVKTVPRARGSTPRHDDMLLDADAAPALRRAPSRRAPEVPRVLSLFPIRRDEGLAPVLLRRRPRGGDRQGAQEADEGARRHGPDQTRRAITRRDPDPQGAGPEHGRQAERDPQAPQHRRAAADGRGHRHAATSRVRRRVRVLTNVVPAVHVQDYAREESAPTPGMGVSDARGVVEKYVYTPRSTSD